jgi:hypothetical protein
MECPNLRNAEIKFDALVVKSCVKSSTLRSKITAENAETAFP